MAELTTDPNDPRLKRGVDSEPVPQAEAYLVLPEAAHHKPYERPVRTSYVHRRGSTPCNMVTTMVHAIAVTYAMDRTFYGATYCVHCQKHLPVWQFDWTDDNTQVGS